MDKVTETFGWHSTTKVTMTSDKLYYIVDTETQEIVFKYRNGNSGERKALYRRFFDVKKVCNDLNRGRAVGTPDRYSIRELK